MAVDENPYWARSPQQATEERLKELADILDEYDEPITVRALTYKAHPDAHGKQLKKKYQDTVADCVRGRTQGYIQWESLKEERTGHNVPVGGFDEVDNYLETALNAEKIARRFRRDKTPAHKQKVECWFEKATVADDFKEVCHPYDIRQVSTRGQVTWTTKKHAADRLGGDAVIIYFGDNDDKGREIPDVLERDLNYLTDENAPDVIWGGVTEEHERKYGMPSESRLDAFEPQDLRDIIRENVEKYINMKQYRQIVEEEEQQKHEIRDQLDDMLP